MGERSGCCVGVLVEGNKVNERRVEDAVLKLGVRKMSLKRENQRALCLSVR